MNRLEDRDLQALAVLANNNDFQTVLAYFKRELDTTMEELISQDEPARWQGKAQFLKEFLSSAEDARANARKRSELRFAEHRSL